MSDEDKNKIKELEEKLTEMENNWKRALADYRNFQKRTEEEKVAFIEFANETLIRKILPVLDNLEVLNKHIEDTGLKMITKNLAQVLEDEGVAEIEVVSKDFDPSVMDAVEMTEGEENKVIEILNKGYFLKDKLLRPARVKVGSGQKKEDK
ncbi:nucleotide exchange factor GrpE [candidate division WWE3 bacterium]|jgi:molecular chaperone GrpE|uniref:Protein GrpE n=1 Tax=candidate division WWE3 bacterium TaxID=2053526 RepID=A0A3A4ZJQ3_UNCKA|nr:MAG: nucleotide exchange factor GrpE [candidate division WWE3 bacterium]